METLSQADLENRVLSTIEKLTGSRLGYYIKRVTNAAPGAPNWALVGTAVGGWTGLPNHREVFAALEALHAQLRLADQIEGK